MKVPKEEPDDPQVQEGRLDRLQIQVVVSPERDSLCCCSCSISCRYLAPLEKEERRAARLSLPLPLASSLRYIGSPVALRHHLVDEEGLAVGFEGERGDPWVRVG